MLNFEKLILHNFGSYQHTEINLQNKGFCLVTGQNHFKKDNALSNGSGKSFLWNAICFALVGETINGLHTNLKNINVVDDPDCFVELSFQNNADHYIITRYVTPRSDLKIIKNGIDLSIFHKSVGMNTGSGYIKAPARKGCHRRNIITHFLANLIKYLRYILEIINYNIKNILLAKSIKKKTR